LIITDQDPKLETLNLAKPGTLQLYINVFSFMMIEFFKLKKDSAQKSCRGPKSI